MNSTIYTTEGKWVHRDQPDPWGIGTMEWVGNDGKKEYLTINNLSKCFTDYLKGTNETL